jgi:hypothetical protein
MFKKDRCKKMSILPLKLVGIQRYSEPAFLHRILLAGCRDG